MNFPLHPRTASKSGKKNENEDIGDKADGEDDNVGDEHDDDEDETDKDDDDDDDDDDDPNPDHDAAVNDCEEGDSGGDSD